MDQHSTRSAKLVVVVAALSLLATLIGFSVKSNEPAKRPSAVALQPKGNAQVEAAHSSANGAEAAVAEQPAQTEWVSLFDGETLNGWELTMFGGEGEVRVEHGKLVLGQGGDLTGVHTHRTIPKINYEVELDAMRVEGYDFFCGLTFPVREDHCSLIVGGWSGGVSGLSCLDWQDASENETTTYQPFETGRWYHIRLQVMPERIKAWIDDKEIVDVDISDKKITVRNEVEPSKPFGFASWRTTAALRNIRIRELKDVPSRG